MHCINVTSHPGNKKRNVQTVVQYMEKVTHVLQEENNVITVISNLYAAVNHTLTQLILHVSVSSNTQLAETQEDVSMLLKMIQEDDFSRSEHD